METFQSSVGETSVGDSSAGDDEPLLLIETPCLILRRFSQTDAPQVQKQAGNQYVSETTVHIPYPYPDGLAEQWIKNQSSCWQSGEGCTLAVVLKKCATLIGCVSIMNIKDNSGEIGYWIGHEYWSKGYCTQACQAFLAFAIPHFGIQTLKARHLTRNIASGKVIKNLGFKPVSQETMDWPRTGAQEMVSHSILSVSQP